MKRKPLTKADLARKVAELESQLAHVYHFAAIDLHKAGSCLMASGVMVQLTAIGGREIVPPFMVKDGLSDATVAALRADLVRSFELATAFKPKAN